MAAAPTKPVAGPLFLGIDCGTQGTKTVVYDASTKQIVGRGSKKYDVFPTDRTGCSEQHPGLWVDAMYETAIAALSAARDAAGQDVSSLVQGIGVSGQQHGLVALDSEYKVIRAAKLWNDTLSAPEASELSKQLGQPSIVAGFTITKLLWLKRNEPENFAKLAHVALPHDYLNYILTGDLVMECGDASGTAMLDTTARQWDPKACAAVDQDMLSKMPRLITSTDKAGQLCAEAAAKLGLPQGVLVSPGGGDNMMSALGSGCCTAGRCTVSLGTSGTLFAQAPEAVYDADGAICPFLDACGKGLPLLCTLNCTKPPEEVREAFGKSFDEITQLAEKEQPGCEGLSFLPYLAGERTPNWPKASGSMVGLRAGHLARPGLLYRAALEGATFSLKGGFEAMSKHGVRGGELRIVGGGSNNKLWRRICADAFQMTVCGLVEPESAARGAALQAAAVHAGATDIGAWIVENHDAEVIDKISPDPSMAAAYDEAYRLFVARGAALFGPGGPDASASAATAAGGQSALLPRSCEPSGCAIL